MISAIQNVRIAQVTEHVLAISGQEHDATLASAGATALRTAATSAVAANLADPASRRVTFNADGRLEGLSSPDADVVAALGRARR